MTEPSHLEERDTICDRCGRWRHCFWARDPFIAEIYPEDHNRPKWWCDDCFDARKDDV